MTVSRADLNSPQRRARVLVVDDYADAADLVCVVLEMLGHECQAAVTGRAALDAASTFRPDIVMLDIGLPDMTGHEIARILRQQRGHALHLIALTGSALAQDVADASQAGFDQYILKPLDMTKITQLLSRASAPAPAAAPASSARAR